MPESEDRPAGLRASLGSQPTDIVPTSSPSANTLPTNVLVLADFGGEDFGTPIAERTPTAVRDPDAALRAMSPVVRVRVEDLSSGDESLLDLKLAFTALADFTPDAFARAVPSVARLRQRSAGSMGGAPDGAGGTDLERAIAAALRGAAPSAQAPGAPDDECERLVARQFALVREVPRLATVERAWRGLARVSAATGGTAARVAISIVPISHRELARELARIDAGDDSELADLLDRCTADPTLRPDLIVVDESFGFGPEGAAAMRALAALATNCAAVVVATADAAALAADGMTAAAGASFATRTVGGPMFAGFRTLRGDPSSSGLALVAPQVERASEPLPWTQSGAMALCEALVAGVAAGGSATPRAGTALRIPGTGRRFPRAFEPAAAALSDGFADCGLIVISTDRPEGGQGLAVGARAPVVFDPPRVVGGSDERSRAASLDFRTRLALARLMRLASVATRVGGAPERSQSALSAFATLLADALRAEVRALAGPSADIGVVAAFDGIDERTLRLDFTLSIVPGAEGEPAKACQVRCACYPLA